MIRKTNEYEKFAFRSDNRERIDQAHVKRLMESIKARNLLELRPIMVNKEMEIIDGQHRFLAAKALGLDIYFVVQSNAGAQDIILMNVVKKWKTTDYLNYYVVNGYEEYKKLKDFTVKRQISLKIALNIVMGRAKNKYDEFRNGKFIFDEDFKEEDINICWETISYIKKMNGFSAYTDSARFWKALLKLVRHAGFDENKWKTNLQKMVERFNPKARTEDYLLLLMEVYNYRNHEKVNLLNEKYI